MPLSTKEIAEYIATKVKWSKSIDQHFTSLEMIKTGREELVEELRKLMPSLVAKPGGDEFTVHANFEELAQFQDVTIPDMNAKQRIKYSREARNRRDPHHRE
jgi:hypothetical protein